MTETTETILIEETGRVGTITLNRPQAMNALNQTMVREIAAAARAFDEREDIGAIVLTGSERAFAAGADIKEMADLTARDAYIGGLFAEFAVIESLRTPVIAAVSGYALGGGCELAMACDFIIAADTAQFGQPEINLGILPGLGGTQRLPLAVGKAKAAEMVLTGRTMDAEEAERSGLVARVVPAGELLADAARTARTIAEKSLPSVYSAKEAMRVAWESPLAEGLRFEKRSFAAAFAFDDQTEGMRAFAEKRKPDFGHR